MAIQERFKGPHIPGCLAGVAVAGPFTHIKLGLAGREAALQFQSKLQRKSFVFFPVNEHHRYFDTGGQPCRTDRIHFVAVKQIHPKQNHGAKANTEKRIKPFEMASKIAAG
jgi:hypothetical protein